MVSAAFLISFMVGSAACESSTSAFLTQRQVGLRWLADVSCACVPLLVSCSGFGLPMHAQLLRLFVTPQRHCFVTNDTTETSDHNFLAALSRLCCGSCPCSYDSLCAPVDCNDFLAALTEFTSLVLAEVASRGISTTLDSSCYVVGLRW